MGILGIETGYVKEDSINAAIVNGLKEAIKTDLTNLLMETAKKEVESVVKEICDRFEINLHSCVDMFDNKRHVKLELIINNRYKEKEAE